MRAIPSLHQTISYRISILYGSISNAQFQLLRPIMEALSTQIIEKEGNFQRVGVKALYNLFKESDPSGQLWFSEFARGRFNLRPDYLEQEFDYMIQEFKFDSEEIYDIITESLDRVYFGIRMSEWKRLFIKSRGVRGRMSTETGINAEKIDKYVISDLLHLYNLPADTEDYKELFNCILREQIGQVIRQSLLFNPNARELIDFVIKGEFKCVRELYTSKEVASIIWEAFKDSGISERMFIDNSDNILRFLRELYFSGKITFKN